MSAPTGMGPICKVYGGKILTWFTVKVLHLGMQEVNPNYSWCCNLLIFLTCCFLLLENQTFFSWPLQCRSETTLPWCPWQACDLKSLYCTAYASSASHYREFGRDPAIYRTPINAFPIGPAKVKETLKSLHTSMMLWRHWWSWHRFLPQWSAQRTPFQVLDPFQWWDGLQAVTPLEAGARGQKES